MTEVVLRVEVVIVSCGESGTGRAGHYGYKTCQRKNIHCCLIDGLHWDKPPIHSCLVKVGFTTFCYFIQFPENYTNTCSVSFCGLWRLIANARVTDPEHFCGFGLEKKENNQKYSTTPIDVYYRFVVANKNEEENKIYHNISWPFKAAWVWFMKRRTHLSLMTFNAKDLWTI